MLKRTPLYDFHVSAGGRMVDFAGWEMPIIYRSIVEEHDQTRNSGSMFDVSHMGRLYFSGPDAGAFLNKIVTRNLSDQAVGQCRYSLVCKSDGGVLDDVIVSRGEKEWILVCNASNRDKIVSHLASVRSTSELSFDITDQTEATAMIALQGPKVLDKLNESLPVDLKTLKRYHFVQITVMMVPLTIFRSGYTGEDGAEIILPARMAPMAMKMIGSKLDAPDAVIKPAGLGARDTLRLEAAMPLYGHELNEQSDPLSAGLGWAVDLTKDFIGAAALRNIKEKGNARKLVGLELEGKRIARQGTQVKQGDKVVGEVTSGTLSPTLQKSIALAYVNADVSDEGTQLAADLKGTANPARIVKLPFYKKRKD